ncbi:hypothetical protein T492DRAFT_1116545 [Pavlovales sp. CCMP2436]|nr:hypothetical protein T492DRAFT_1116545 [Pavlovales sp. CCMP2436]
MALPVREVREVREVRLTDLPSDILEHVLGNTLVQPSHIASALNSCRAFSILDPWRPAFMGRWGKAGVRGPRAFVGKMAYILRDCCERLVSGPVVEVLVKVDEHAARRDERRWLTIDKQEYKNFRDQCCHRQFNIGTKMSDSYYHEYPPFLMHHWTLESVGEALARCATSEASACALMAALEQGLFFLSARHNSGEVEEGGDFSWGVFRFVLASPRGDLVVFNATDVDTDLDYAKEGRIWQLHANVVEAVDEPHLAKAICQWLCEGPEGHISWGPRAPSPPPGCGESICLVDCKFGFGTKNKPGVFQSIKPPPSPAVVSSLFDSLGLDKGVVHPDDLLLALLAMSTMVPGPHASEIWDAPRALNLDEPHVHPSLLMWKQGKCMTWASASS